MAVNATYRGHVDGSPTGVATSGPISVVAGEALVVCVVADSYQDLTNASVTMSTGWGFNFQVHETMYGNSFDGGYAGIFAAVPVPANGSPTITVTTGGSAQGHRRPSFDIWSVSGQHASSPVVQTDIRDGYGNPINLTFRSAAGTAGNTIAIICGADGNTAGQEWVSGSGISAGYGFTQPSGGGETGLNGFSTAARWTSPDTNQFVTVDPDNSWPAFLATVVMEFQAAPQLPVVNAGADRTVERTLGIIRTAGETSDGGSAITSRQWRLMSGPAGSGAPVNLAAYGGDPKRCLLPNQVAGTHVIRYTATNAVGGGFDEATITVTPKRPTVDAGPDAVMQAGTFTRTAQESAGDTAITARRWYIVEGPSGVGSTIGSAAALTWTPPSLGRWVLGYTATNSGGTSDADSLVLTVGVTGIGLHIGRTPEPKIAVAVAFGGDLTSVNGSTWAFTEITSDVRVGQGIHLRHGASDEASATQPAQFRCTLTNTHGRYSLGGLSPNWPNVRQGTPVQVSVDLGAGAGFQVIFTGYADGWSPGWSVEPLDTAGRRGDAVVTLVASGALRRMAQGTPPYISPMRRGLSSASDLRGYWPCEDEKNSTVIAPSRPEWNPLRFSTRLHGGSNPGLPAAKPRLAESNAFLASDPLPLVSDSEWYANVIDYVPAAGTNAIQLRFLIDVPAPGVNNESVIIGLITTGDPSFWEIRYRTTGTYTSNGQISIRAWRNFQTMVMDIDCANIGGINGRRGQLGLQLSLSGSNIRADVDFLEEGAAASAGAIQITSGFTATVGRAVRVQTTTDGGMVDMALGHIVVRSVITSEAENIRHLNAWNGDTVGARLSRLTADNGTWFTMLDGPSGTITPADYMGPQPGGTVLELLRDCEATDRGILWDGVGPGLSYTTRRYRESRAPAITLDATAGQVGLPFGALHDDQRRVNRAAVSRRGGSNAMYLDDTGPLGANLIGRYDTALTVGCQSDSALGQYAAWSVFQGTTEGYRFPQLSIDFRATPELLDEWLAVIPGARVDVTGLRSITTAAPEDAVALGIEGYEQVITSHTWKATLNTSLFRRWAVACVTAETGDTQEFGGRIDTSGAQLAAIAAAGVTSLTVDTTTGTLWTTRTDDYPLDLDLGAIKVRATACTAGGVGGVPARQTFTLAAPLPVTRPAGTRVQLWNPPVFGL